MWDIITTLAGGGATVLLTLQYLEEADQLADSISVIDEGSVIAQGTADELKASIGGQPASSRRPWCSARRTQVRRWRRISRTASSTGSAAFR